MGVNKVIYYGEVLVDMSQVTVTPDTLGKGVTALDAKGDLITGQHECQKTEPKLQAKTVTPSTSLQTVNPDSGYDGLSKVTVNAMPTATQATPSITVSSSGLITAKSTQSAGYVASGTKQATKQLTTQAAKTITPSTSQQTAVASGRYTTGAVTVAPIPSNYEDVTEETNAYTDKIASLESAVTALETELQGKASGGGAGGGVETCSVRLYGDNTTIFKYAYTCIENGAVVHKVIEANQKPFDVVVSDVVIQSLFAFRFDCSYGWNETETVNGSLIFDDGTCDAVSVEAQPGGLTTIHIVGDD